MNPEEMDQKHQEGIKLMNTDEMFQDGAEILMELANLGHIDSIEQLVYVFLDQKDFDDAESYINCAKDPNNPIILYLKARLIEERDGEESALESFRIAADYGSPNAILTMFNLAIWDENVVDAEFYFEKVKAHEKFLSILSEPTTLEALQEELEELKHEYGQEEKIAESLVESLNSEDFQEFYESLSRRVRPTDKTLASKFAKALILERIIMSISDLFEISTILNETNFFAGHPEYELLIEVDDDKAIKIDEYEKLLSFISLVKLEVFESGDSLLTAVLDSWDKENSSGFASNDFSAAISRDPKFVTRLRDIAKASIDSDLFGTLQTDVYELGDLDESFYAGGASYSFSNINVESANDLAKPCDSCGRAMMLCEEPNCNRSYFFAPTGIDCSVDVFGMDNEETEELETILISVSELGKDYFFLLAQRVPSIVGKIKLHRNRTDHQIRLLIGDSFPIDYENHEIQDAEIDFEDLMESFIEIVDEKFIADEYLVVSWQTPYEFGDGSHFIFGLYRGQTRSRIESVLQNEVF